MHACTVCVYNHCYKRTRFGRAEGSILSSKYVSPSIVMFIGTSGCSGLASVEYVSAGGSGAGLSFFSCFLSRCAVVSYCLIGVGRGVR